MDWIFWSDSKTLYQLVAGGLWVLCLIAVFLPTANSAKTVPFSCFWNFGSSAVFLTSIALFILAGRWPGLFGPQGYNPDEDQLLAAARNLWNNPVFFLSAECGSSGPINVYPLLLSGVVGHEPSLFSGRIVALLLIIGSIWGIYFTIKPVIHESIARAVGFSLASMLGWTYFWDFRHYTSEHTPVFLLCISWALTANSLWNRRLTKKMQIALACIAAALLSLVPFAKLQATHLALASGMLLLIGTYFKENKPLKVKAFDFGIISISTLFFPLALGAFFYINGVLDYAWKSYIENALVYQGGSGKWIDRIGLLYSMLTVDSALRPTDLTVFVCGNIVLQMACITWMILGKRKEISFPVGQNHIFVLGAALLLLFSFLTITSTMRNYPHYLYFLPFPLVLLSAGLAGLIERNVSGNQGEATWRNHPIRGTLEYASLPLLIAFLTAVPLFYLHLRQPHPHIGLAKRWFTQKSISPVAQMILKHRDPSNPYLAVWGYNPVYYTETEMLSATRLSTSSSIFIDSKLKGFYLDTYLSDLQKNMPSVFVDAVAPGQFLLMNNREEFGIENVPEINNFIRSNYNLVGELDGVRFFKRH